MSLYSQKKKHFLENNANRLSPPPPKILNSSRNYLNTFEATIPKKINHALSKNLNPLKYVNNQLPPSLTQTTSFLRILSFLFDLFFITFQKQLMLYFCFGGGGGRIGLKPPEPTPPPNVRGLKVDASLSCDDRITVDRLLVGLVMVM